MLVTQLCLTLCDPMDCSPPGCSVYGILQARTLEWVAGTSLVAQLVKNPPANAVHAGDGDRIPGLGRSWRRVWQPTPVFLPGKFHGLSSLVGYSPWGHRQSNTTESSDWAQCSTWVTLGFTFCVLLSVGFWQMHNVSTITVSFRIVYGLKQIPCFHIVIVPFLPTPFFFYCLYDFAFIHNVIQLESCSV